MWGGFFFFAPENLQAAHIAEVCDMAEGWGESFVFLSCRITLSIWFLLQEPNLSSNTCTWPWLTPSIRRLKTKTCVAIFVHCITPAWEGYSAFPMWCSLTFYNKPEATLLYRGNSCNPTIPVLWQLYYIYLVRVRMKLFQTETQWWWKESIARHPSSALALQPVWIPHTLLPSFIFETQQAEKNGHLLTFISAWNVIILSSEGKSVHHKLLLYQQPLVWKSKSGKNGTLYSD